MQLTPEERKLIEEHRKSKRSTYEPRLASDYTEAEKCAAFDKLHKLALGQWYERHENDYCDDNDFDNWCAEAVMGLLAGDGDVGGKAMWTHLNSLH